MKHPLNVSQSFFYFYLVFRKVPLTRLEEPDVLHIIIHLPLKELFPNKLIPRTLVDKIQHDAKQLIPKKDWYWEIGQEASLYSFI